MKYSDAAVRNRHMKHQSKYDSEKQMSDHPRDLIISGVTTCGSHKAEETATWLFFVIKEALEKELQHLGAPATLFNYFFYVNFNDQDKCAPVLYNLPY